MGSSQPDVAGPIPVAENHFVTADAVSEACDISYSKAGEEHELKAQNIVAAKRLNDGGYSVLFVEGSPPRLKTINTTSLPPSFTTRFSPRLSQANLPARSHDQDAPNTHVIISTLSGTGLAPDFYSDAVRPVLTELELHEDEDYTVHYTKSANTVTELTKSILLPRANQGIRQHIILLSGDGGIVDILNALMSEPHSSTYVEPIVSLIPMGTGNALAHSTGITSDDTLGLSALVRGAPQPVPMLSAKFSPGSCLVTDEGSKEEPLPLQVGGHPTIYGAVVCSWGLHAGLVADSDTAEYRKYGVERFKMAATEALFPADGSEPHKYKARVKLIRKKINSLEWEEIERDEHAYVLATLVSNLEKQFMISPLSKPLEGNLRIVQFGPMSGQEVMRVMGLAYQEGKHVTDGSVGYEDIEGAIIEFKGMEDDPRWRRICVDGKIIRVEKDGWVEIRKEKKRVLQLTRIL